MAKKKKTTRKTDETVIVDRASLELLLSSAMLYAAKLVQWIELIDQGAHSAVGADMWGVQISLKNAMIMIGQYDKGKVKDILENMEKSHKKHIEELHKLLGDKLGRKVMDYHR